MSLFDHLEELRTRLIRSVLVLFVAVVVGYFLAPWPLDWLSEPIQGAHHRAMIAKQQRTVIIDVMTDGTLRLRDQGALASLESHAPIQFHFPGTEQAPVDWTPGETPALFYLRPIDPFMIRLKAAMIIGLVLALPFLLFETWGFIAPGLLERERRFALPVIIAGSLLFPFGAGFAYLMLDVTLDFFASFVMGEAGMMNDARAYLGFALGMMLAFGLVFELPLVLVLATRVGLVTVEWLESRRRLIFVAILVVAAVATPSGDPLTMMAMGVPLYFLFEAALIVSRFLDRQDAKDREAPVAHEADSGSDR